MDQVSRPDVLPPPPRSPSSRHRPVARLGRSAPRSRLGCVTCKQRHVRCDEAHPSCGNCARLQLTCQYRTPRSRASGKQTRPVGEPPLRPRQHGGRSESTHSPLNLAWLGDNDVNPLAAPNGQQQPPTGFDSAWDLNVHDILTPGCSLLLESALLPGNPPEALSEGADSRHQLGLDPWPSEAPWEFGSLLQQQEPDSHDQHRQIAEPHVPRPSSTQKDKTTEAAATLVSPSILGEMGQAVSEASPLPSPSSPGDAPTPPDTSGHGHLIKAFKRIVHPPAGVLIGGVRRWRRLQRHLIRLSSRDPAVLHLILCVSELFENAMEETRPLSPETQDRVRSRHAAAVSELQRRVERLRRGETESGDDLLAVVFLLGWFHVLRDRMSGGLDSEGLAFPSSEADAVITTSTTWNWYSKQLLSWFNVLDSRAAYLGEDFLLSPKALDTVSRYPVQVTEHDYEGTKHDDDQDDAIESAVASPSTSQRPPSRARLSEEGRKGCPLTPPLSACDVKKITLRFILQPGVDWYLQAISFHRRIAALDKHHRRRFTPDDEMEVMTAGKRIEADLWELWAQRPSAISLSPAELAMSVSSDVAMTSAEVFSVHLATFWSLFVYLHRVSWWHLEHTKTANDALNETWSHLQASYGEVTDGGRRRIIHPSVMWPVFMLGIETKDKEHQAWATEQLAALGAPRRDDQDPAGGYDTLLGFRITPGSTRNASRASLLLRAVVERQGQLARRVDELDLARELFGAGFSLV